MSDKRRRRRRGSGGTSDEDEDEASITASDHEYESAAEDSALDESEDLDNSDIKAENGKTEADEGILDLSDKEDLTEERGAGDGQEEKEGGKVDDDEDRRNPQYIPKKGMFYEHDDRIDTDEEEAEAKADPEDSGKKRVPRSEAIDRWGHDKFLEREQAPKSKEELVNTYGYDIRNEDNAPRARRRRRYGRGPNKYTRNWEDEKAYDSKPPVKDSNSSSRGGKTGSKRGGASSTPASSSRGSGPAKSAPIKSEDPEEFPALPSKEPAPAPKKEQVQAETKSLRGSNSSSRGRGGSTSNRGGGGRNSNNENHRKSKPQNKSDFSANQRLHKEPKPVENSKPTRHEKAVEAKLDKEFAVKAKISDDKAKDSPRSHRKTQEDSENSRQPKRYSNSRNSHNRNNNRQEYYNDVNGTPAAVAASSPAGNYVPVGNSGPPPAAPFLPPQNIAATPTSSTTSGFLDPTAMVNYGPPPPVQFTPVPVPVTVTVPLVTAVPPTVHDTLPVLAPPLNPNVTNAEVLLAAAAAGQGYAEVRGGVTYFNPTAQPHPMMARPVSKRPKAAIPIVDPSQVPTMMSPQNSMEEADHEILDQQQPKMMLANT